MPLLPFDSQLPILPETGEIYLAPTAYVIGKVRIGEGANLWYNVTARGDIEWIDIGANSNVQEGATLHTDFNRPVIMGEGCTIGHGAIVHGCILGEHCLVGMHATILNGATIGKFCIIGANTLIREGAHFPDYSLIVGNPARIARNVTEADIEKLRKSAYMYKERARNYAQQTLMETFPKR